MKKTKIYEQLMTIPTYKPGEPEKNPLFIEKRAYQGSTGKVYPVPVTEKISEEKTDETYKAVILENDYLYVMVLPELGGRIQRAYDKTNGYDFVYYNHVIKPALVGLAGPWISGGIEFNWPQHHRPSTFMPVDYALSENPDGSATVTVGETDCMNGTKGNAAITLYPDKAYIEIKGRLFNPTDYPQTFLWWANPAVAVNDETFSVFPPDVNSVFDHGKRAVSTFPIATGEYYKADYSEGVDISRYKNIKVPTSYMAAHSDFDFVGNFDEGKDAGLLHVADHHISPGKKQWTWGCGDFGKTWDKNLTDEDGPYIELMTGMFCDNQPDFTWLKPQEEKNFVQYFMPYKTVGRVSNATKDVVMGIDFLDKNHDVMEISPFAYGKKANDELADRAAASRIKVYASGTFEGACITATEQGQEVYKKIVDLSPISAFTEELPVLKDYVITVTDAQGVVLCEFKEYVKENQPIPDPATALPVPEQIGSMEELYLAGQHLEQYRHATYLPTDYYLEGLKRDAGDMRINNAYGLFLLRNAQVKESVPYFKAAIARQTWRNPNPYHGEAYFNLGLAKELLGELDEAYDAFYKATWSAETAGTAFYHLAAISVKRGDYKKALEFANESLYKGYHNMKTRALKAGILEALHMETEAFLNESIAIDPLYFGILYRSYDKDAFLKAMGDRISNYTNLALELIGTGFYADAIKVVDLYKETNPMLLYCKAFAYKMLGQHQEALAAAKEAEQACPDYCFPNKTEEFVILEQVVTLLEDAGESAAMAHYYIGNLLYDKKQYEIAVYHWEITAKERPDYAMTHRNLSIAYYNHLDKALARDAIAKACEKDPSSSRFLLEQDQLLKRLEVSVQERLEILEAHQALIPDRYALMLAYVSLLNANGRYEDALSHLMTYTFHVWEGGEGKVADEYKTALFALAEKELAKGDEASLKKAIEYAERTIEYPDNLGEGKLENVPDHHAYYLMGCAYRALHMEEEARKYLIKAASGNQIPEPVRYYNDQPSDYIFYQGLAFAALGDLEQARKSFHQLIIFGERHIFDEVGYDFFAVSMPELEVYQDDIKKRSDDYCKRMTMLGHKGLSMIG